MVSYPCGPPSRLDAEVRHAALVPTWWSAYSRASLAFWKWRGGVDQLRAFFVHGRDVPALGTAVHTLDSSRPWSWVRATTGGLMGNVGARVSECAAIRIRGSALYCCAT